MLLKGSPCLKINFIPEVGLCVSISSKLYLKFKNYSYKAEETES